MQSEIPWKTGKARFLTSTLKDKERKKQKKAVQKALHFEERPQKKTRGKKNCAVKRNKWPDRQQRRSSYGGKRSGQE